MDWLKIRSWHVVRTWTRVPGRGLSPCGRILEGDPLPMYPADEKTCEVCLRWAVKQQG